MRKNYRWLPVALLALGVRVATPACVGSVRSARGDGRQSVQPRPMSKAIGRDSTRDATTPAMDVRNSTNGIRITAKLTAATVAMTATATPIALYSGKDSVTAMLRRSMSNAKGREGTEGAQVRCTAIPQATRSRPSTRRART